MSSANCLPRCPHRVATAKLTCPLLILLISIVTCTTATESLYGQELLDFRLVDPASHMQPWPDGQADHFFVKPQVVRIATKWRTKLVPKVEEETQQPEPKPAETQSAEPKQETPKEQPPLQLPTKTAIEPAPSPSPVLTPAPVAEVTRPESTPPEPIVRPETIPTQEPLVEQPVTQPDSALPSRDCYQAPLLSTINTAIALPAGKLPVNAAVECAAQNPPTSDRRIYGGWNGTNYHWSATCMHHRPLYFEEINAERYGYTVSYALQPFISSAHFFATIPALPYKMVVERPRECIYTLGHYRPGSCAPRRCNWPGWSLGAGAVETGTLAGLILLIP